MDTLSLTCKEQIELENQQSFPCPKTVQKVTPESFKKKKKNKRN